MKTGQGKTIQKRNKFPIQSTNSQKWKNVGQKKSQRSAKRQSDFALKNLIFFDEKRKTQTKKQCKTRRDEKCNRKRGRGKQKAKEEKKRKKKRCSKIAKNQVRGQGAAGRDIPRRAMRIFMAKEAGKSQISCQVFQCFFSRFYDDFFYLFYFFFAALDVLFFTLQICRQHKEQRSNRGRGRDRPDY